MSDTTSANPDELDAFADGTTTSRGNAESSAATALTTVTNAQANSGGRGLSATNLPALNTLLSNMGANEVMVRAVATALREADASEGVVTTSNAAIVAELAGTPGSTANEQVVVNEVTLLGAPATSGFVDDPICAANGNFIHIDRDLEFPGTSASLDIRRFYNSLAARRVGAFGAGWTSVLDVRLVGVSTAHVSAHLADGAVVSFVRDGDQWTTTDRRNLRLIRRDDEPTCRWTLADGPTGSRQFDFDEFGALTCWRVNASVVDVARDARGEVSGLVEQRSGRSIAVTWQHGLVASLKTDDRRLVTYDHTDDALMVNTTTRSGTIDYAYENGLMVTAHDADGITMFVNEYDDTGRVTQQLTEFGRVVSYRYDDAGSTVISDQRGVRQAMLHDRRGNLVAVIDVDGSAMRLTYDEHDRVVNVVSKSGQIWGYEFDDDTGDLVRRTDPDGRAQSWTWDHLGRKASETDRVGAVTRFEYRAEHDIPVRVTGPDGSVATAVLDQFGQIESTTDPDGVQQHFAWDRDGQLTSVTDVEGNTVAFEFDPSGLLTKITDAAGVTTDIDIDDTGRVTRSSRADAISTYDHTPAGRVAAGTEPGDIGWSATFGSTHGALETISDALGATVHFAYDELGDITTVTAPDGARYRNEYDLLGRLVATADPTGATTRHGYDVEGRLVEVIDAEGGVLRRSLDKFGRTVKSESADGSITRWTYHPNGEVATITEPDGRTWTSHIDALGRIDTVVSPSGGRAERTYTPAGRVATRTSPSGHVERYEYDRAGRCAAVVLLAADGAEIERRAMSYDERGLVVGVDTARGDDAAGLRHLEFEWDAQRRVVSSGDRGRQTRLERDAGGRVLRRTDPVGAETAFRWDERGLLTAAIDPAGMQSDYTHDQRGRLIGQTMPGGRHTGWTYDVAGRLGGVTDPMGVAAMFERNANGVIVGSRRGDIGWTRDLDPMGREIGRTSLDGAVLGSYEYDAAGRLAAARTGDPDVFTEFLWDDDNGLGADRAGASAREHGGERDDAGRLTIGPDGTLYEYDDAGRLTEMVPANGDTPTRFAYQPDGLLRSETGPHGTRSFQHDLAGRVTSISIDGVGTTEITYDEAGRRASEVEPDGTRVDYGWNALDQLTSITRTTSEDTQVVTIDHDALGRPARLNGVPLGSAAGTATGVPVGPLNILGARTYDRRTRQFLSTDPLLTVPGSNGGASAYTYAWHDPVNYVDPSGMRPISIEEYSAIREREENGRLGQAWQAIQEDPWGSLAAVAVVAVGVGLMFTPAAAVGAGILIGAGMSAGVGLATGTFSPTAIAIGGVAGGATGGVGALTSSTTAAVATGAVVGAGSDLANQMLGDGPVNWNQVLVSGTVGAGTAGIGAGTSTFNSSATRAAATGAATDAGADVVTQLLTGDGNVDWSSVIVSGMAGGTSATAGYHIDNHIQTRAAAGNEVTPVPLMLEAGPPPPLMLNAGPAAPGPEMITVYRGTSGVAELNVLAETGLVVSDAGRAAYYGSGEDIGVALAYSDSAHAVAVDTWGSEADFVEAHSAFGREIEQVSGDRTMISVTTDLATAERFAHFDKPGVVLTAQVPAADLLPQTLPGAGEWEHLAVTSIEMTPYQPAPAGP